MDWKKLIEDFYSHGHGTWNREQVEMAVTLGKITREEADAILDS